MRILTLALLSLFLAFPALAADIHSAYIYTNKSTPETIQGVVDAADTFQGDIVDYAGEYRTDVQKGVRGIVAKSNGVDNPKAQRTITYAKVHEKVGATGYYVMNPIRFLETRQTVVDGELQRTFSDETVEMYISGNSPDDVPGIYFTDDISDWLPAQEGM